MADPTHGAEHGAEAASGGMPQLDFTTFPSQIFWLLVALFALYYIISKIALPKITGAIDERHDAIEDDLDRAADFKRRAQQAEQAYEAALAAAKTKAQSIAAEARAAMQKQVDAAIARADVQISAKTAESEKRIAEIRDGAMASVEAVARETAGALVESFIPGASAPDAVRGAVAARLHG